MSDAPKVLYFNECHPSTDEHGNVIQRSGFACSTPSFLHQGPYVDLEWFLGEVNKIANEKMRHMSPIDMISAHKRACRELAKQIKEGKTT